MKKFLLAAAVILGTFVTTSFTADSAEAGYGYGHHFGCYPAYHHVHAYRPVYPVYTPVYRPVYFYGHSCY